LGGGRGGGDRKVLFFFLLELALYGGRRKGVGMEKKKTMFR